MYLLIINIDRTVKVGTNMCCKQILRKNLWITMAGIPMSRGKENDQY